MEAGAVAVADEKVVGEYYTLSQHMDKTREVGSPSTLLMLKPACSLIIVCCVGVRVQQMRAIINQPSNVLRFLQPGRLVKVKVSSCPGRHLLPQLLSVNSYEACWGRAMATQDGADDWGVGVVVNFQKRGATSGGARGEESTGARFIVDVLLRCKPRANSRDTPRPCPASDPRGEMNVVRVAIGAASHILLLFLTWRCSLRMVLAGACAAATAERHWTTSHVPARGKL